MKWFGKSRTDLKAAVETDAANAPLFPMTIDGAAISGEDWFAVSNPATGEIVGRAPKTSKLECEAAIAAADRAFRSWSRTSDADRADACRRIADILERNGAELARLITLEQGKPLKGGGLGAEFETAGAVGWARATADLALQDTVLIDSHTHRIVQTHVPLGPVASITPWNWPLLIAMWHILPAVRTGNTVVCKPSPFTPLATLRAVSLLNEALPPGVVNCIAGGPETGALLSADPRVRKIAFTGSTRTGQLLMREAAANVKRLTLELGGNDAAIILPGASVDKHAAGVFFGSFINVGQTCGAIKRLYVPSGEIDAWCAALAGLAGGMPMGNGLEETSVFGPTQNGMQFERVKALVEEALRAGAKAVCGGRPSAGPGLFYPITVLRDCAHGMRIVDEEQFGPALPIIAYDDLDQAIAMANDSEFGLCASVWGDDPAERERVAQLLDAGTVYVNTHAELNPITPFGGRKTSGLGVSFGVEGLAEFTDVKVLYAKK